MVYKKFIFVDGLFNQQKPTIAERDFAHFHISNSINFPSVFLLNIVDKSIICLTESDNILT